MSLTDDRRTHARAGLASLALAGMVLPALLLPPLDARADDPAELSTPAASPVGTPSAGDQPSPSSANPSEVTVASSETTPAAPAEAGLQTPAASGSPSDPTPAAPTSEQAPAPAPEGPADPATDPGPTPGTPADPVTPPGDGASAATESTTTTPGATAPGTTAPVTNRSVSGAPTTQPTPTGTMAPVRVQAATSWSLRVSQGGHGRPGTIYSGYGTTLSGTAPAGVRSVSVWEVKGVRRVLLARVTPNASGSYSTSIAPAPGLHRYQATNGSATGSSVVAVTVVRPPVALSAVAPVDSLKVPAVKGTFGPAGASRRVQLFVWTGSRWVATATGATTTQGTFSLPFSYKTGWLATYQVMAQVTLPDGSLVASAATPVERRLVLSAVVRATTSADVAKTYRSGCPVGPSGLRTVEMNYLGYDGLVRRGVLVVRADLATKVVNAFTRGTVQGRFPIKSMLNPNAFGGDDVKMMAAGNTSAFNCRRVTGNPYAMSPHSYGKAIDVNTIENPYRDPSGRWYPSTKYATNRPASVKGLLVPSSGLTIGLKANGYRWFTGWDWQHFEV